jgi:SOS-response transcriptional repressor LexA
LLEHAIIASNLQARNRGYRICVHRKLSHDALVDRNEIKARMKVRRIKQVDLANALGIDPDKVSKSLDTKGTREFSPDEMVIVRQMLREDGDLPEPTDYHPIPIIGQVQAGNWTEAVQRPIGAMPSPEPFMSRKVFGLQVSGDSMDEYVEDGATVLVDPDDKALFAGRFYVVINEEGETTYKRYQENPSRLVPCSSNKAHKDIVLGGDQTFTIVGRVIWRAARM